MKEILNDFLDYRAYVSHTLCKHRLFLGLECAGEARERLSDACVWPLVADETDRLLALAGTLYGLRSARLDTATGDIRQVLVRMRTDGEGLLAKESPAAFKAFRAGAEALNELLGGLSRVFEGETPDFSAVRADAYLAGRSSADCLESFLEGIRDEVLPQVKSVFGGGSAGAASYRRFWLAAAETFVFTRAGLVAGFLHGFGGVTEEGVRDLQRRLRRIERVVSCWSPAISEASRQRAIEQTLRAEGYASTDAILLEMEALAR